MGLALAASFLSSENSFAAPAAESRSVWERLLDLAKAKRPNPAALASLRERLPEAQRLAADFLQVYTLKEADQPEAFRRVLLQNFELLSELANSALPIDELLDEKLWSQFPETGNEIRRAVGQTLDFLKTEAARNHTKKFSRALIEKVPERQLVMALAQGSKLIADAKISSHPGFRRILDPETGVKLEDENLRRLANTLMPAFFDELGVKIKARIAAAVLRLPPGASTAEQASAVLQNAGPMAQKLFQLIGEKTDSKELEQVMVLLKENIQPIEMPAIQRVLDQRFGPAKVKELFSDISGPKNSGSVGQVHFATLRSSGEEVVIKVLRPGVEEDFALEAAAMRKAAGGAGLESIAEKFVKNIGLELDFRIESANIEHGAIYVDPEHGISIAHRVESIPAEKDVLVTRKAPGASIKKFVEPADLLKRGEALEDVLANWMKVAIFRNGFFHGDLHTGNLFLDVDPKYPLGYQVTVIDFGNASRLTRNEQKGFMRLISAITLNSPEEALQAMAAIGHVPDESREALRAELTRLLETPPRLPLHSWISEIMRGIGQASLKYKVDFPESFIAFQRGKEFLENQIDLVNKLLDEKDPAGELKRFDPARAETKALLVEMKELGAAKLLDDTVPDSALSREVLGDVLKTVRGSVYLKRLERGCAAMYRSLYQLPY